MNWDQVHGNWKQMGAVLQKKWGKLTGDDLAVANGDRNLLLGRLEERYGLEREEAERELNEFVGAQEEGAGPYDKEEVATEGAPVDMKTLKIGMHGGGSGAER